VEHAADTREALVAAARRLFAASGYDGTGTEQIVAEARVTRGALYHHFRDKADLFRAAMAEAAGDVALQLVAEQLATDAASPLQDIRDGVSAFLDVCVDGGDFQRIVLVDGPRVLGSETWEDLVDRYGRGLLEDWLARAVQARDITPLPTGALARLLIAMLTDASLAIGRATHPAAARAELGEVLDRMLTGLRPPADLSLTTQRSSRSGPRLSAVGKRARRAPRAPYWLGAGNDSTTYWVGAGNDAPLVMRCRHRARSAWMRIRQRAKRAARSVPVPFAEEVTLSPASRSAL